jgi:RNA polymerase sigma-70 factor (ECF subfamily)
MGAAESSLDTDECERLIAAMARGDQAALRTLHGLTVTKLFGMARRILKDPADVEEVVCDAYLHAWRTAAQYRCHRGSVVAWLMIICRNRAIDRFRNNAVGLRGRDGARSDELADAQPSPLERLLMLEREHAVQRAVAELPPLRRELLALAFFRGLTHPEIAADTRLALGTVKSHLRRAMHVLRKRLPAVDA